MKEEPLDLDDQVEGGLYPEAEEQGNLRSKRVWAIEIIRKTPIHILPKRRGLGCVNPAQPRPSHFELNRILTDMR